MAVKIHTVIEMTDIKTGIVGHMSPRASYKLITQCVNLRTFKRAVCTPLDKGEAIQGGRFVIERGDDIKAKFQGWYYPDVNG